MYFYYLLNDMIPQQQSFIQWIIKSIIHSTTTILLLLLIECYACLIKHTKHHTAVITTTTGITKVQRCGPLSTLPSTGCPLTLNLRTAQSRITVTNLQSLIFDDKYAKERVRSAYKTPKSLPTRRTPGGAALLVYYCMDSPWGTGVRLRIRLHVD